MAEKSPAPDSAAPAKPASPASEGADVKPAEDKLEETSPAPDSPSDSPEKPAAKDDDADNDDKSTADADAEMGSAKKTAKGAASPEAKDASDNEDALVSPSGGQEDFKTPVRADKGRRKSAVGSVKSTAKKAARVTITNLDAQPGEQYLVKLKGFPPWPVIIADEDMLPAALATARPVSAKKADGTWNEPFADGGKRIHERKLPIMYLHTNELGWTQNTMLQPLDREKAEEALTQSHKMKKDLKEAFELAAEEKPLSYYKGLIVRNREALAREQEHEVARVRSAAAAVAKAKRARPSDGDGDLDMPDEEPEDDEDARKKTKKRKAEDVASTPQRTDSIKKPKIKLTATPKASLVADAKSASKEPHKDIKVKLKKSTTKDDKKEASAKTPDAAPEEKKRREVLFLRHRMQRGLLMKDPGPKVDEIPAMSEHLAKLESQYPDLEVSIMRETKINKVLKAIIKLDEIPRDAEFKLRERSAVLLEKWNKLLAADAGGGGSGAEGSTNGVSGKENGAGKDVEMPDRTKEDAKETA